VWLLEEIGKSMRGFFWAAKEWANGGQCLVSWEQICKPIEFGGLGVKDLRLQGIALRMRWSWLRRTDPSRPWQGLPLEEDEMARTAFESLVQIKVGNGELVYFWGDRWINGKSVAEIAPGLWSTVSARVRNRRTVQQAPTDNAWLLDLSSRLTTRLAQRGAQECVDLWLAIYSLNRDGTLPDVFTWPWSASGVFSVSSAYGMLTFGSEEFALADAIWKRTATPKCKQFMWLAVKYGIWTSDRRFRHGLQATSAACFICL
jgi:hypothetical protein